MSLLNIANQYSDISGYLSTPAASSGDYVKLFFSKDGHIITHGRDFLATFNSTTRGLVPAGSGDDVKKILRGNASWAAIATTDLPMAASVANASTTTLLTSKQIVDYVNASFAANDAMRYKGTIAFSGENYTTHTTAGTEVAGFPTKCEIGDTYRITSPGVYAGQNCSSGDLLICIKDGTGSALNAATYWTAVEANINGEVNHKVNNVTIPTYSRANTTFTIYAPTSGGTQNQVLLSNGNAAPVWAAQSVLKVGEASKVSNKLSAGAGLSMGGNTYDGSAARTISVVAATATTIGGVIVDNVNATKKTISVNSAGSIYLTHDNVCNALGYDPASKDSWRPITVGGTSIEKRTLNFIPSGDVYLKADVNDDGIEDISFGLSWYNINKSSYETA